MSTQRSRFAGGDQQYLRNEQYGTSDRLAIRARLHARYTTATVPWFDWVAAQFGIAIGDHVLEVGCGAGWLWEQTNAAVVSGASITLVDLSPGMVDEAVQRVTSTRRFQTVRGEVADAQSLPFESRSFERVIANHMLYHLPDPALGVAELARVVRDDGMVIVATNGRRHMQELWRIRGDVFDLAAIDQTVDVFGVDNGFTILRDHFADVRWLTYRDELRCTDVDDVVAYLTSTPPAEDATADQLAEIRGRVQAAFDDGDGVMTISKDTGCFVCRTPTRP